MNQLSRLAPDKPLRGDPYDLAHVMPKDWNAAPELGNFLFLTADENVTSAAKPANWTVWQRPREADALMAAFMKICSRWQLSNSDIPILLGYLPEYAKSITPILHSIPQTRDLVDRIAYLHLISLGLGALFNDQAESEVRWLNAKKAALSGETPLDHMRQGHIHNLITVKNLVARERGL